MGAQPISPEDRHYQRGVGTRTLSDVGSRASFPSAPEVSLRLRFVFLRPPPYFFLLERKVDMYWKEVNFLQKLYIYEYDK